MTVKSSYYFTLSQSVTAPFNENVVSVYVSQNLYSILHISYHLALWTITDQSSNTDSFLQFGQRKQTKFSFQGYLCGQYKNVRFLEMKPPPSKIADFDLF